MKLKTKELIVCGLFAGITAILAQISIPLPFTTVPMTMQLFAVVLSGILLGQKLSFISQIVYIMLGAIGMPVFAQMSGGLSALIGPTGGFILSFPLVAYIVGYFSYNNSFVKKSFGMLLALASSYLLGTLQFMLLMKVSFIEGLTLCVLPFIIVDLLKLGLASVVGITISKRMKVGLGYAKN